MSGLRRRPPFGPTKCYALLSIVLRPWAHRVRALFSRYRSVSSRADARKEPKTKENLYIIFFLSRSMPHGGGGLRLTAARLSQALENERAWVVFVPGLNESRRLQSYSTIRDGFKSKDAKAERSTKK